MLVFDDHPETLAISVTLDASTGLPFLHEQGEILRHVTTHLTLPYSVGEYGCGKRASLILARLLELDIPPYAVARGLVVEADMSSAALAECDPGRRPHALIADNPLWSMSDLSNPHLQRMLEQTDSCVRVRGTDVEAGHYQLHHAPRVQFIKSRSHVYPILWCWDEHTGRAVKQVIDPTLSRGALFGVEDIRAFLHAPEALLFSAPLLGHFRLDEPDLTAAQRDRVRELIGNDRSVSDLTEPEHARLVRDLCGAEPGSVGDPETWSYANNMLGGEAEHDEEQRRNTGRGDGFRDLLDELLHAREAHESDIHQIRADLRKLVEESDVDAIVEADTRWSTTELEPLADLAVTVVYFNALESLAKAASDGVPFASYLDAPGLLEQVRGLGVRLRRRLDRVARLSEDDEGRIDARALNARFFDVTLDVIRQMNEAGLTVFVDKVGSVHGALLDEKSRDAVRNGRAGVSDLLAGALAFCSHVDSVKDAGRFDGRLGVLGGVEAAHVLRDLEECFGVTGAGSPEARVLVSAFIGEEMSFTGRGVSMPGSAAVAGRAEVGDVHEMTNGEGDRFGDRLVEMLRVIACRQREGVIEVANRFDGDDADSLLDACFDPRDFYTPHTYERHIEQGPVLDRTGIPMALVGTIMGIHQEDFIIEGARAEPAALEFDLRLRGLTGEPGFEDVRITVGIIEPVGAVVHFDRSLAAFRWTLVGEKNHAGATATPDRRDPGVAAARLVRALDAWVDDHPELRDRGLEPVVGNIRVTPGTDRNVIPGQVSLTIGLVGGRLDPLEREDLEQTLTGYAIGTLAKSVPIGGEGMSLCRVEPISYANVARRARLAIDLRAGEQETIDAFRARIDDIVSSLRSSHDVRIGSEIQQQVSPYGLQQSGQVLLLERSYGGSHNPAETELSVDITRGCMLQLSMAREFLGGGRDEPDFNLFDAVERTLPDSWRSRLDRFVSGALHDTCNIAARARS